MRIERLSTAIATASDEPNPVYDAFLLAGMEYAAGNSQYGIAYTIAMQDVQTAAGVTDDELLQLLETPAVQLPLGAALADTIQLVPAEDSPIVETVEVAA